MTRVRLGMLTPSSNTTLEPMVSAMLRDLPEASAHFARFRVTEIALGEQALRQFDTRPIVEAARLLADAKVGVIAWSGTSSGWLGFEADRALCDLITAETGIPACTSVLALNEVMTLTGRKRFGLVTPFTRDVQQRIEQNYRDHGYECVAEQHLGWRDNYQFAEATPEQLREMVGQVAAAAPDCITTFCTNLRAADLVAELEGRFGIPVYDTISTAVWKSLKLAGVDTRRIKGWGRLFSEL